jgi:hypothetical protein
MHKKISHKIMTDSKIVPLDQKYLTQELTCIPKHS